MSMKQTLTMIAAASANNLIGVKGQVPWRIPEDMRRFKELTLNHPVIMGRKTWLSIPEEYRPLSERRNIILSRTIEKERGMYVARNIGESLMFAGGKNLFIIGGQQIYEQFLPLANRIELTKVYKEFEGDAFFPDINWSEWDLINREFRETKDKLKYSFETYVLKEETFINKLLLQ